MALFKISKGLSTSLPEALTEGYCWYTYNDSKFYIDFKDENGVLSRKALNAKEAERLTGYDITTILNSSDVEIPTSKAVLDALEEVKVDASTKDVVVLSEAQKYADQVGADAFEAAKIDASNKDIVVLAEAQKSIDAVVSAISIDSTALNQMLEEVLV